MTDRISSAVIEAAGGIIEDVRPQATHVAVVRRKRYGPEWTLPKGKREPGESWQETALREVGEETGLKVEITGVAGASTYLAQGVPKLVMYWRMKVVGDRALFEPNEEVDRLEWLPIGTAIELMTHPEDAQLLRTYASITGNWPKAPTRLTFMGRLVRTFRFHDWERARNEIASYRLFWTGRAADSEVSGQLPGMLNALRCADDALNLGNINGAWANLYVARRLRLFAAEPSELRAIAESIIVESGKLKEWRKNAVKDAIETDDEKIDPIRVALAATIRDEHYQNQAIKNDMRRITAAWLAVSLTLGLALLLIIASSGLPNTIVPEEAEGNDFKLITTIAVLGLLGASMSAITRIPRSSNQSAIPETVYSMRLVALRLLSGPVSAIAAYFALRSGLLSLLDLPKNAAPYVPLVVAFAAGFTERLVARVIERFVGVKAPPQEGNADAL